MRAIEIAISKYRDDLAKSGNKEVTQRFGKYDFNNTYSGYVHEALEAFTGNKTQDVIFKDGVAGVNINNEFVTINKENLPKLRRIPLKLPSSVENLNMLKQYGDDVVIYKGMNQHAYNIEFGEQTSLDIHEPWNSQNTEKFTPEEIVANKFNDFFDIMFL